MYTVFRIARRIWNPEVTVAPQLWNGQNVTLFCKASNLAYQQLYLYHWVWTLKERELKETGKHRIYHRVDSPNSCNQSDGITHLHISNVSKLDIGQYRCVLLMSDMKIAEDDVVLSKISMFTSCHFYFKFFEQITFQFPLMLTYICFSGIRSF